LDELALLDLQEMQATEVEPIGGGGLVILQDTICNQKNARTTTVGRHSWTGQLRETSWE